MGQSSEKLNLVRSDMITLLAKRLDRIYHSWVGGKTKKI